MKKVLMVSVPEEIYHDALRWCKIAGYESVEQNLSTLMELHTWLYKLTQLPPEDSTRISQTATLMMDTGSGRRSIVNFIQQEHQKVLSKLQGTSC